MTNLFECTYIKEPLLLFGGSNPSPDPKLGLTVYGPYSWTKNSVGVGIIGNKETIQLTRRLLDRLTAQVEGPSDYPLWTPDFPGLSVKSIFKTRLLYSEKWYQTITKRDIDELQKVRRVQERISFSTDLFIARLRNLKEREDAPDVVICAPPQELLDLCALPRMQKVRYKSRKRRGPKRRRFLVDVEVAQKLIFDFMPEFRDSQLHRLARESAENFHHQLKGRAMDLAISTQMILPSTLEAFFNPEIKKMQDPATVAWNLCVALLYKAGARPWRLSDIPQGTCYIGVSFYREKRVFGAKMGTSLAQVFTPEGEGLVLRGERFEWPRRVAPHLDKKASKRLVEKALKLYDRQTGQKPVRVVIHKSSLFSDEEIEGFKSALQQVPRMDFVALEHKAKQIRFFRSGYHPVLRGSMITLPDKTCLLYTKGYIPFLKIYPGPRIPRPLEVLQHIGDTPSDVICKEILALSKLNRNSADFSSFRPITLEFSRQVGQILRETPPGVTPQNKYLYYM